MPPQTINIERFRELDELLRKAQTDREVYVVAYHFAKDGLETRAVSALNRLAPSYFTRGLYRDLFHAVLAWSMYKSGHEREDLLEMSQFYLVVRYSIPLFSKLKFLGSKEFMIFSEDLTAIVKFTNPQPPVKM